MKSEDILIIGAVVAGGYLVYRLAKPLTETVEGVGDGITTGVQGIGSGVSEAFTGTGSAVSDIVGGVSSPFSYFSEMLRSQEKVNESRMNYLLNLYKSDKDVQTQLKEQTVSKEKQKTLQENIDETKYQNSYNIVSQNTDTTSAALANNYGEQVTRKTSYGVNAGEFLAKTFMPTADVAQQRRENALNALTGAKNAVVSVASKASSVVSSGIKSATSGIADIIKKVTKKK